MYRNARTWIILEIPIETRDIIKSWNTFHSGLRKRDSSWSFYFMLCWGIINSQMHACTRIIFDFNLIWHSMTETRYTGMRKLYLFYPLFFTKHHNATNKMITLRVLLSMWRIAIAILITIRSFPMLALRSMEIIYIHTMSSEYHLLPIGCMI